LIISTNVICGVIKSEIPSSLRHYLLIVFRSSGRTKQYINTFGEEVIVDNAEQALAEEKLTQARIKDYTAGPVYFKDAEAEHMNG
jgi:hypothetical protein